MIKSMEIGNKDSCLNKALDHERIFVMLERDPSADAAIEYWANDRIKRGLNKTDDPQIQEAFKCAADMRLNRPRIIDDVKTLHRGEDNLDDPHAMSAANADDNHHPFEQEEHSALDMCAHCGKMAGAEIHNPIQS